MVHTHKNKQRSAICLLFLIFTKHWERKKKYFMKVISFPGALSKGFIFLLFQRKEHIAPNITVRLTACSEARCVGLYCTFCGSFTERSLLLISMSAACSGAHVPRRWGGSRFRLPSSVLRCEVAASIHGTVGQMLPDESWVPDTEARGFRSL